MKHRGRALQCLHDSKVSKMSVSVIIFLFLLCHIEEFIILTTRYYSKDSVLLSESFTLLIWFDFCMQWVKNWFQKHLTLLNEGEGGDLTLTTWGYLRLRYVGKGGYSRPKMVDAICERSLIKTSSSLKFFIMELLFHIRMSTFALYNAMIILVEATFGIISNLFNNIAHQNS